MPPNPQAPCGAICSDASLAHHPLFRRDLIDSSFRHRESFVALPVRLDFAAGLPSVQDRTGIREIEMTAPRLALALAATLLGSANVPAPCSAQDYPTKTSVAEFDRFLRADIVKWAEVVKTFSAKP